MGIQAAVASGIDLPQTSSEVSARNIINVISRATRGVTSGNFIDADTGEEISW
jgi:hypothetical protein